MTNELINFINSEIRTLDDATKAEINLILVRDADNDAIDIAIEISDLDYFLEFNSDTIMAKIEKKIVEIKSKNTKTMTNAIISLLEKRVCLLDNETKREINTLVVALDKVSPLDLASEIAELDYFSEFDADVIAEIIEEEIIEINSAKPTLKELMVENATDSESNYLIRSFSKEVSKGSFSEKEISEAQHFIKETIKAEIVADLDNRIDNFKHFLKRS